MSSRNSQPKRLSSQAQKFIEAASELGCDENESAFDEIVKKVAKAAPPRQEPEKPKAKKR
jgi:hypothetical protein